MDLKTTRIFSGIREYILPFLLTFVLNASILGIYDSHFLTIYNLLSGIIILLMYFFFEFIKKHRFAGSILYVVLGFIALNIMLRCIFARDWGRGFNEWFLTGGSSESQPRYFYALVSVFPFFLSSVVYYFSVVLYRTSFLMLCSLIPCAVYVKVLSEMSDLYLVLIAGLNTALYIINYQNEKAKNGEYHGKNAQMTSIVFITCIALLISSLIPKQGEAIYYDKFEDIFMDAGTGGTSSNSFTYLNDRSGDSASYRELENTPLYDVFSDEIIYMRRQSFDLYDPAGHFWYPLEKYSSIVTDDISFIEENALINYDNMLTAVKKAVSYNPALKGMIREQLILLENAQEETAQAMIVPLSAAYKTNYLIAPVRTVTINNPNKLPTGGFTRHKQISSENGMLFDLRLMNSITYNYYREFSSRNLWFENGGADFTDEEYSEFLDQLYTTLEEHDEAELCKTVSGFMNQFEQAMEYKADYSDNISAVPDDIAALAAEITAGCVYDWQKASALQDYFQSGEYTYDLDYIPPEAYDTPSYFVFTSKTGTCSDFATAYTLMARSLGLTVRYTEGFSPDITSEENVFRIRASGSHAYPEVYIQNAGWIVFEPTVSSMYAIGAVSGNQFDNNGIDIDTEILFNVLLVLCGVSALAAVIILSVPLIRMVSDEVKINKGGTDAILLIYRRMNEIYSKRNRLNGETMTPHEFSDSVKENTVYDISGFISLYEEVCFGGKIPSESECEEAHSLFKTFRSNKKK